MRTTAIGVIGGSGFYELLESSSDVQVDTPYGPTSASVAIGSVAGHDVAFIARHGRSHGYAAHRVPYRANVWAMKQLGVDALIASCSTGSLQPDIHPGQLVLVDQLVDRTWGRADTFFDVGGPDDVPGAGGPVHHQAFADPYDAEVRKSLAARSSACRHVRPLVALG